MNDKELIKKKSKQIDDLQNIIIDLNDRLKESESMKSNFISNVMNEVYNPFSSIIYMADNILSLKADKLQKAIPMAEVIYSEAAKIDFHLQNIFTAATIEAGLEAPSKSRVHIGEIYKSVQKTLHFNISSKRLSINSNLVKDSGIEFITDSQKLTLILLNLLSNAIKFSPLDGIIEFNCELIENHLNITISDQGPGISDSDLELVFDRFKRVDDSINSITGGAGLGLSVVKALTEILNGNIKIRNDNGTCVHLVLPQLEISEDDELMSDEELF